MTNPPFFPPPGEPAAPCMPGLPWAAPAAAPADAPAAEELPPSAPRFCKSEEVDGETPLPPGRGVMEMLGEEPLGRLLGVRPRTLWKTILHQYSVADVHKS